MFHFIRFLKENIKQEITISIYIKSSKIICALLLLSDYCFAVTNFKSSYIWKSLLSDSYASKTTISWLYFRISKLVTTGIPYRYTCKLKVPKYCVLMAIHQSIHVFVIFWIFGVILILLFYSMRHFSKSLNQWRKGKGKNENKERKKEKEKKKRWRKNKKGRRKNKGKGRS